MGRPKSDVRVTRPPLPVLTAVNVVVRPLLSSRLGRRMKDLALLEFTGRRSGRTIRVPVGLHSVDGVTTVMTDRPWRLNFAGGAPVTVTVDGAVHHTRAVLVPATRAEMGVAMRKLLDSGTRPSALGLAVRRGHEPTAEELAAVCSPTDAMITIDMPAPDAASPPGRALG